MRKYTLKHTKIKSKNDTDINKTHEWLCDYLDLNEEESAMVFYELEGLRFSIIKECIEITKDVQEESWNFVKTFTVPINELLGRLQKLILPK